AELAHHVRLAAEVEVRLDRAGAVHHVETAAADGWHVARHHPIALLGHTRGVLEPQGRREAEAQEADPERGAGLPHLLQMLAGLARSLVQCGYRRTRQLELTARLERDRLGALTLRAPERDDVVALGDRLPGEASDHL